ncbi:MAG: branched-chain amino acid ABC transporter permease [Pseudonocardia sp.]|uniref:branched-chain amino acid ABC transporter permease n=1 Tax=unclassified Pseudonocardia TaxID=2619320 RepID=UPI000AF5E374|nr:MULTISPECIES: branched-chain amino acid ABC transporter permease [unclassified Pseudonocardia]MBN9113689.1 branched-chain amino acid ABC transporter permease [Pseudonocardia sp.]
MTDVSQQAEVPDNVVGGTASVTDPGRRRSPLTIAVVVVVVLVLAAAPLFLAPFATTTLTRLLVFGLLAVSLDLLVGVTGLPSLGHAAYFGAGAYAAGWVSVHVTAAIPVPLLVGAVVGGVAAAATGWVAVRSAGVYFLMLTLAIGEVLAQLAQSWDSVTGGANGLSGIPAARLGGEPLVNAGYLYWYVLVVGLVAFALVWLLARSPFGAALRGIRDNEPRMRAIGYPTVVHKYAAFVAAGTVAGAAGSLLAAQQRLVTPSDLGFTTAALVLLAVVIGGAGTLWGPVVGAAVVILVRDALGPGLGGHGELLLGIVFVLVVYLLPRGAAGLAGLRPFRRRRP